MSNVCTNISGSKDTFCEMVECPSEIEDSQVYLRKDFKERGYSTEE